MTSLVTPAPVYWQSSARIVPSRVVAATGYSWAGWSGRENDHETRRQRRRQRGAAEAAGGGDSRRAPHGRGVDGGGGLCHPAVGRRDRRGGPCNRRGVRTDRRKSASGCSRDVDPDCLAESDCPNEPDAEANRDTSQRVNVHADAEPDAHAETVLDAGAHRRRPLSGERRRPGPVERTELEIRERV